MDHLEKLEQLERQLNSYKKFIVCQPPDFLKSEWYLLLELEMDRIRNVCSDIKNERLHTLRQQFPEWDLVRPSKINETLI